MNLIIAFELYFVFEGRRLISRVTHNTNTIEIGITEINIKSQSFLLFVKKVAKLKKFDISVKVNLTQPALMRSVKASVKCCYCSYWAWK